MSSDKHCPNQPPTIDLSKKSLNHGTSSWILGCEKVRRALEDYGWFVATYDDLTSELHDDVFKSMEELFDLPLETKQLNTSDKPYHGYFGQQPRFPVYESLGIEEAHEMTQARSFTDLMWPNGNAKFCESINAYSKLVSKMESLVQRMLFESYGVKNSESSIASMIYNCRMMKYRVPIKGEPNLGAFPHTDKAFLSILHQNEVKGLEVKTKDGRWIVVDPFPSSFVVMAGEGCKAWSNGRIHSAVHKVMMSEDKDRYSIGVFSFNKGTIQVPDELIDDQNPRKYNSFDHLGLLRYFFNNVGKVENTIEAYCGVK